MSDTSVFEALRTDAQLVVVEAPAGCGKTHQAAEYARWLATTRTTPGSVLILTHTHAACDVFRGRTADVSRRVTVSTIDGLITQIATVYHQALGLPHDVSTWARTTRDGFETAATKVAALLAWSKGIAAALASRHPIIICDEHQDANEAQHAVVMAIHAAGAKLRVFGDPMQSIFGADEAQRDQWANLIERANTYEELDYPHRWDKNDSSRALGLWVLRARATLKAGQPLNLRDALPENVNVVRADNQAGRHGGYMLDKDAREPVDLAFRKAAPMLILCAHNQTIRSLRAFWYRSVPIWEGHTNEALTKLIANCKKHRGKSKNLAKALVPFMKSVGIGFTQAAYGKRLSSEIDAGCTAKTRGKPLQIQSMARLLLDSPDHRGVASVLAMIRNLAKNDTTFKDIKIDLHRELRDAIRLGDYQDVDEGFADIARKRTNLPTKLPTKALSTIHKAKGLETSHVIILPCDVTHFAGNDANRCLLYVALSRATCHLTLVVSPTECSPLIMI